MAFYNIFYNDGFSLKKKSIILKAPLSEFSHTHIVSTNKQLQL